MTDSTDIITAWLAAFGSRSVREADPLASFQQLTKRVPGVVPADITAAADLAKSIGSELRSLAHRVERAAEHERRRNGQR